MTTTPPEAPIPGPDSLQNDYFSRLAALTRDHLDLLPLAFLGGRRGQTILSIYVLDDGTIGRIAVKRSSGYPDIDTRIEQIARTEYPETELLRKVSGVGTLIAYSYVRYKTPWCIINVVWPFLFIFGAAVLLVRPGYRRVLARRGGQPVLRAWCWPWGSSFAKRLWNRVAIGPAAIVAPAASFRRS